MAKMTAAVMEEKIKTEFSQPKLVGETRVRNLISYPVAPRLGLVARGIIIVVVRVNRLAQLNPRK